MSDSASYLSYLHDTPLVDDSVELLSFLSEKEHACLAACLPARTISTEIARLLSSIKSLYSAISGHDEIIFSKPQIEGRLLFPCSVEIACNSHDNRWIIRVDALGNWKEVYNMFSNPYGLILQAENLIEFQVQLEHCFHSGLSLENYFAHFPEEIDPDVLWDNFFTKAEAIQGGDLVLQQFAQQLPDHFLVLDFRKIPQASGCSLHRAVFETLYNHPFEPIWGIEFNWRNLSFKQLLTAFF